MIDMVSIGPSWNATTSSLWPKGDLIIMFAFRALGACKSLWLKGALQPAELRSSNFQCIGTCAHHVITFLAPEYRIFSRPLSPTAVSRQCSPRPERGYRSCTASGFCGPPVCAVARRRCRAADVAWAAHALCVLLSLRCLGVGCAFLLLRLS
jgi:hypothetical protein